MRVILYLSPVGIEIHVRIVLKIFPHVKHVVLKLKLKLNHTWLETYLAWLNIYIYICKHTWTLIIPVSFKRGDLYCFWNVWGEIKVLVGNTVELTVSVLLPHTKFTLLPHTKFTLCKKSFGLDLKSMTRVLLHVKSFEKENSLSTTKRCTGVFTHGLNMRIDNCHPSL